MRKFRRLLISTEAAEVAELAVVLPILVTMIFAIFSFGRAYNVYSTVTRAAQEGARVAVTPACAYCSPPCGSTSTTGQFPCDDAVLNAVSAVLTASNVSTANIVASPQPVSTNAVACPQPASAQPVCTQPSGSQLWVCRNVLLTEPTSPPACGTLVSFRYSYQLLPIPFFNASSFTCATRSGSICIPAQAQMRVEY